MKGRTQIRNLGEGECFGEMSYLSQVKTTAGIVANGEVMIWSVTPGLIEGLSCKSQLGFQDAFIEVIVQRLTRSTSYIKHLQKIISKVKKKIST